ncbi:nurim homolog [Phymastichus coffea]|uniref:nurim homolog n=1 Tax=Phymastichus coffea TaxID=108790 RepID=UPI00273BC475|nr:nurim homolog [Phymastichus coffea]
MISKIFRIAVCTSSFLYTFYVLCKLTYFLSKPVEYKESDELELEENLVLKTLWILIINITLLSVFIIQHSVMAMDVVKDIYFNLNMEDIERSIYNASSAAVLHLLVKQWQSIPWISVWNFSTSQSNYLWFTISACQVIGWCIVYAGCVMMDISELAGLKQVYYKLSGRPRPMTIKSRELQRFFLHMRHPSLTGFLIILWIYPLMSIDRLLLASILSSYMILMWSIDYEDYSYQSIMISKKQREFNTETY